MAVYLDHASTSPLRPEVLDAMLPFLRNDGGDNVGDPGRLHRHGQVTRVAVEDARSSVAALFGARPREVVFCSSGTEAINAALWSLHGHVVSTAVERAAVLESIERSGVEATLVGVDHLGCVDPAELAAAVRPDTTMVSVQLANHEVGSVQDLAPAVAAAHAAGALVHVDATAASGHLPFDFAALGADLCSVTSHTFGGPLGVGALLVRRGLRVAPMLVGGAQERARRAGPENVPAIVGFGAACGRLLEIVDGRARFHLEADTQRRLIDRAWHGVATVPGVERFGSGTLPNLLCVGVAGVEAEPVLLALDQQGVSVHSGAACSSETWEPSPVLAAMGVDAQHSLRMSVGWNTTPTDIDAFVSAFAVGVERLRSLRA